MWRDSVPATFPLEAPEHSSFLPPALGESVHSLQPRAQTPRRSRRSGKGMERTKARRRRGVRGVAILATPGKSRRICCVAPVPVHRCSLEAGLLAGSKASRMEVTFSASLIAGSGHDRLLEERRVDVVGVLVTGLQKAGASSPYLRLPAGWLCPC